jgi:hypothetical protein
VLTVLRGGYQTEILRKVWFDRTNLQVSRLETYGPRGMLLSDVHVSDWQPLTADEVRPAGSMIAGVTGFPRAIRIDRPHDDYRLDLQVLKVMLNDEMPAERFKLDQPPGSELVRVGETAESQQQ